MRLAMCLIGILMVTPALAEEVITYEKVDDNQVKITTTIMQEKSLDELEATLQNAIEHKVNWDKQAQAEIDILQKVVDEARIAGVKNTKEIKEIEERERIIIE